jgi:hypothetical protein
METRYLPSNRRRGPEHPRHPWDTRSRGRCLMTAAVLVTLAVGSFYALIAILMLRDFDELLRESE